MTAPRIVLAEYFLDGERAALFLADGQTAEPEVREISADFAALHNLAARYFAPAEHAAKPGNSPGTRFLDFDPGVWRNLLCPFVEPVLAWTQPGDLLYLVPHGVLHYLPVHAVPVGLSEDLIDRNPVVYAPSASVLRFCREKRTGRRHSLLALADSRDDDPLFFAREQALAVAGLFPHREVFLGPEATIGRLVGALTARRDEIDVIHLAVHGRFRAGQALASGIRLADGEVTAEDFFGPRLEMRADLVTLSACESGLNEVRPGDELLGLTRSLIYAGTPSVVVSLWSVDELSTSLLMRTFYAMLMGDPPASKAEALREAQRALKRLTAAGAVRAVEEARPRLEGDPIALAYLDLTLAEIRLKARDYQAAEEAYRTLLLRPGVSAVAVQARRGVQKARLGAGIGIPLDYDCRLYNDLYYWAPFILVGDWL